MPIDASKIQVLYEISLSISPEASVEETVETAAATYLQKLNCSAAAVFETRETPDGRLRHDLVTTLPTRSRLPADVEEIRDRLPGTTTERAATLPVADRVDGVHRYVMALPGFGVLVLFKRGSPLDDDVLASLADLNEKLATACNRVTVPRRYESQYRDLFEDAPVMFALTRRVDGDPVVVDCNRQFAEKLGYAVDEVRDRQLAAFLAPDTASTLLEGGYGALAGESGTEECVFRTREDAELITTMRAAPRLDEDGNVVGTQVLFVDVTELKRREQQISVLNRVLRHNLRNDLAVVRGKVDLLRDGTSDATDLAHLDDIRERTENLLSTADLALRIQQLFDRTEVGRQDLVAVTESVVAAASEKFPAATVEAVVPDDPVPVLATEAIDDAVWELVENACEHAGEAPTVAVTVDRDGDTVTLTVADDGPGIPEVERQILGAGRETDIEHGSGLGLWLAHWVVNAAGGELRFDCADGTTVEVRLSVADAA